MNASYPAQCLFKLWQKHNKKSLEGCEYKELRGNVGWGQGEPSLPRLVNELIGIFDIINQWQILTLLLKWKRNSKTKVLNILRKNKKLNDKQKNDRKYNAKYEQDDKHIIEHSEHATHLAFYIHVIHKVDLKRFLIIFKHVLRCLSLHLTTRRRSREEGFSMKVAAAYISYIF
jgi:hypothetical protein